MIKAGCFEQCCSKTADKIDSFNEKFYDYLNRAVAGENPYELEIDKKWANFIYKSSKMTFIKFLTILITIAPSFTQIFKSFMAPPIIKECYVDSDPSATLPYGECLKYNNNSPLYMKYKEVDYSNYRHVIPLALIMLVYCVPHLCFMAMVWWRFSINKYTVWISAAKIHLLADEKRGLTAVYYVFLLYLIYIIYSIIAAMATLTEMDGQTANVPYINQRHLIYIFEKTNSASPLALLSLGLVYSCLITFLFAQIRQPMTLFSGFRQYLKKASRVPYNIWTVDYRIKRDSVTWKFIKRYYQECERYDRSVVLIAMVTHFLDLELLKAEGEENEE